MNTATKTRTQRRMEKKQTLILLVLVLAVSLASFTLGVVVGRRGAERDLVQHQQAAEKILVTKAPRAAAEKAPLAEDEMAAETAVPQDAGQVAEETKLTFYDKLAKEEAVPLGSGINLPPQPKEEQQPAAKPPIALPEQPIVKKTTPVVAVAKTDVKPRVDDLDDAATLLPKADPKGTYSVQVGSFAAAGDAGAFKKKLIDKGFSAFVVEADLGAKGLWYRVRLGPYADAEAAKTVQQLAEKKEQIKGFISRQ